MQVLKKVGRYLCGLAWRLLIAAVAGIAGWYLTSLLWLWLVE